MDHQLVERGGHLQLATQPTVRLSLSRDGGQQLELFFARLRERACLFFIDVDVTGRAIEAAAAFAVDAVNTVADGREHHAHVGSDLDGFSAAVLLDKSHSRHPTSVS
ncbi:hypothetical protein XF30_28190 [Bradyrhizobium sp. SUTN9-2]|nr:hypothetical protein XF30_28190 [Bradyrhizobium sp. SUTN9-2]